MLNELGIRQAEIAANAISKTPPDAIVASPLSRARQTAAIIADACRLLVEIDGDLTECAFGPLEVRSIAETMAKHAITRKEQLAAILLSDAETLPDLRRRTIECVERWQDARQDHTILLVSHDAVIQSLSEALCGRWIDCRHGAIYRFARNVGQWTAVEVLDDPLIY